MVECLLPKQDARVQFPSFAPKLWGEKMSEIIINILTIVLVLIGLTAFTFCAIGIGKIIVFTQMEEYNALQKEKQNNKENK